VTTGSRTLCTLEAGSVVGELAVMTGELRAADVRAEVASELAMLAGEDFRRLLEAHPIAFADVLERAQRARRENQIAANLAALFGELDRETLLDLESEVDWLSLRAGEQLFREGDAADAAYVVASGRLRAVTVTPRGERVLSEMGRGETVGEMALLSRDVRSASVFAVRDSQLLRITESAFEKLIERRPAALRTIAGFVIDRLREQASGQPRVSGSSTAIAVVPATRDVDTRALCRRVAGALAELGRVTHLDRERVDAALGRRGAADAAPGDPIVPRLSRWLDEREAASDWLLFEADADSERWTSRAARQADHVLIVARASRGHAIGEVEARLQDSWSTGRGPTRSLVLLWDEGAELQGTRNWLELRPEIGRHFHVRADRPGDVARLARRIAGRSIGLVLGGGGARSFAHLGVLRALEEIGVPIDAYGGTSMGSLIAAVAALEVDAATAEALAKQHLTALFDPTLPLVSLLAGRRIGKRIETVFGARTVEDMPIPFYCIATDLSAAEERVLTRGPLATALRASISLPGILPPVVSGQRLLVDGALLNNVPVDVMTAMLGGGQVIAVDVSPDQDLAAAADLPSAISGWALLWRLVNPFGRKAIPVSVLHVLARSGVVASIVADREHRSADSASLYLKVPVAEWGLLDFKAHDAIADRGYQSSRDAIVRWWGSQRAG
jgi:NTE family protein/lysophospholipid hydrolase